MTPPALGARKGRPGRAITGVGAGRSPGARLEGCGPGMEYGAAPEGPASLEPEPRRERRPLPAVPASVRERERGEGTKHAQPHASEKHTLHADSAGARGERAKWGMAGVTQ